MSQPLAPSNQPLTPSNQPPSPSKQPVHPALEPLKWLIGKWECDRGAGSFPTIKSFQYCEELEFTSYGHPLLQYTAKSFHPVKNTPMHYESGFLRIKPDSNNVAFMVAHNFGLVILEEGRIEGGELHLKSTNINRMSFAREPAVNKIERHIYQKGNELEQVVHMETSNTPLTEHLRCTYRRVPS